jgi:hypothetical protein
MSDVFVPSSTRLHRKNSPRWIHFADVSMAARDDGATREERVAVVASAEPSRG